MPYLIFIKSGYTAGPQSQTVTETQKIQAAPAISALIYYASPGALTDSFTESQKLRAVPTVTAVNYV